MKKYIPVFGPQELFDNAPEHVEVVIFNDYSRSYIWANLNTISHLTFRDLKAIPIIAMRKIEEEVPEPKRWTVADQQAGRLPEVGAKCRQGHKDEIVIAVTEKFVVTECQDMSVCTTRKDVFMRSYNPIETPAEKAQRERDEWIDNACSFICFYDIGRVDAIKSLEITYDKLKSGELSMPKKDGE